jgi:hypothetical protein
VYVVRSNIAKGTRPEVFHIKLRSIVMDKNHASDIRLEPFDQIHVGETRQARVERCIPPWLLGIYRSIWDTHPAGWQPKSKLREKLHNSRHD